MRGEVPRAVRADREDGHGRPGRSVAEGVAALAALVKACGVLRAFEGRGGRRVRRRRQAHAARQHEGQPGGRCRDEELKDAPPGALVVFVDRGEEGSSWGYGSGDDRYADGDGTPTSARRRTFSIRIDDRYASALAFSDNVRSPNARRAMPPSATRVSVCSLRTVTGSRSPRWWTMTPRRSRRRYALGPLRAFGTALVLPRAGRRPRRIERRDRLLSRRRLTPPTRVPTLPPSAAAPAGAPDVPR